ncbi:Zeta toxin family protein [Paramagnetospirillum kuznetsovii]|uniref:Zeta toxin family protein n=1 Tax=Paramagnetospirillum kuznetsovii TaxID=2053833 RepID=A0A364NYC9_9PROT|nr:zeta toxin family protein [Paramagnetospirillum kuznetsovii]RAU21917.1 Zeta toxin family protein [Paramagnetospirillum kuznetsovii]
MPHDSAPPVLWIFGGPNGAGKTTTAKRVLKSQLDGLPFVNVDEIAARMNPLNPSESLIAAGREAIERIRELRASRQSFVVETTLASRGYLRTMAEFKMEGWECNLFFVGLESAALSRARVDIRVADGGHDIPDADIVRRFDRINKNFPDYVRAADLALVFDNSRDKAILLAEIRQGMMRRRFGQSPLLEEFG